MTFSLSNIADQPEIATYSITLDSDEKIIVRPLVPSDVHKLATFLQGLSQETRRLSTFNGYDLEAAKELCDAINKYDKLRFVVESLSNARAVDRIVGLLEFSFGLPESDVERFAQEGYKLNPDIDCRFGPTFADDYQNMGLGSKLFPFVIEIARQFGKQRIILWGGVLKENGRAIHYYEKIGFKQAGNSTKEGVEKLDMILELKEFSNSF